MDRKNDYDYDYDYDDVSNIISTNINHYLFSSTSTSPPTTPTATTTTTTTTDESTLSGSGLYRARLIMENRLYNELLNRYQLAISRLRQLSNEATALKEENEWLKLANEDLIRRFNRRFPVEPWVGPTAAASGWSTSSHTSVIDDDDGHNDANNDDDDDDDDDDDESFSLPKSISVRSPGFFKLVNSPVIANNQSQSPLQHVNGTRLKVRKEEKAIEMDVFNQGMYKTELCNKWEETRTCPYGQHCQFAHGLSELRPVIRHPRYKTQICRMVVAGVMCPYGHRCHFRHSLS